MATYLFDWRLFLLRMFVLPRGKVLQLDSVSLDFFSSLLEEGFQPFGVKSDRKNLRSEEEKFYFYKNFKDVPSDSFDVVIIWNLYNYLNNFHQLLSQTCKSLKSRGWAILRMVIPQFQSTHTLRNLLRQNLITLFNDLPIFIEFDVKKERYLIAFLQKKQRMNSSGNSFRVIFLPHPSAYKNMEDVTGPTIRIFKTMEYLKEIGVECGLSFSNVPDVSDYHLAHAFCHAWDPKYTLEVVLKVKQQNRPVCLSTVYMDIRETNFALNAIPAIFSCLDEGERKRYLDALQEGKLWVSNTLAKSYPYDPILQEYQNTLFEIADMLICFSRKEIKDISSLLNVQNKFVVVPNAADSSLFGNTSPEWCLKNIGIKDFILSVGHIEARKNQLMLLYALKDIDIPVVLVGGVSQSSWKYYELCKAYANSITLFIPQLKREQLASCYAAAKVHALPSWVEGVSISSLEAAMSGCNIVITNRGSEREYFGKQAFYCDPADIHSIRANVLAAYSKERNNDFKEYIRKEYSYQKAALATLRAYQKIFEG